MIKITLDSRRKTVLIVDKVDVDGDEYVCKVGRIVRRIPTDKVLYVDMLDIQSASSDAQTPPAPVLSAPAAPTLPVNRDFAAAVNRHMAASLGSVEQDPQPTGQTGLVDVCITGSVNDRLQVLCDQADIDSPRMTEELTRSIFDDHQVGSAIYGHNVVHIRKDGGSVIIETRESLPEPPPSIKEAVAKIADVSNAIARKFGNNGMKPDENT